jgi:alkylation response protein AidB-like acyl-CoA dehydrogenase
MESAMAKLFLSEGHIQSCLDAIQIHGGYGYMTEFELERELRDAVPGTIYSGTSESVLKIDRVIPIRVPNGMECHSERSAAE